MNTSTHPNGMPASMLDFMIALSTYLRELVEEQIQPLKAELHFIKSLQSEWVDTKEALKITGLKKAQTLKAERERLGTVVVVKFEGKMCSTPRYLRTSLLAYNDKKTKHRITGRPLN
jgi:predicted mannosyl-3-phosphoglycerate phosphatase (HAD superfamily)